MKTGRARTEKPVKKRSLNKVSIECTKQQPGTRARAPNLAASHYRWKQTTAASGSSQAEPGKVKTDTQPSRGERRKRQPKTASRRFTVYFSIRLSIRKTQ
ncbi:unnamed protein product [Macrosiphum euphorbiae]|uniref:Uncharacterized protein n=1 Tax=Macrosiphum euphorbiae TaxID=13131 RepID=A0AAV0XCD5_9HEMI|nr:unnamed protein product [Macrosiphum euphorbiae]